VSRRLEGRRGLITGAAGGIGSAIASAFVREGARIAAIGRNRAALEELCTTLSREFAHPVPANVSDAQSAEQGVRRAAELLDGLDMVVNAAAVDCVWKPVGEMPVESWDETIATNLSGTFYVCRAALPLLVEAGGGSIVNLTSVAGVRVWPLDSAYNVSKAGVEMLTRTIAVEYGAQGVRANCLAPGVIDAGMTDTVTDPSEREELVRMHPLGRMGSAEEVAEAAVWLASSGSFTTGWTLAVDGGFLARG
jgi:NAD(P)-dependent dehydrogenase (short-subunit alcohol dehydrogenase family)